MLLAGIESSFSSATLVGLFRRRTLITSDRPFTVARTADRVAYNRDALEWQALKLPDRGADHTAAMLSNSI